jgi:hypothetical protein
MSKGDHEHPHRWSRNSRNRAVTRGRWPTLVEVDKIAVKGDTATADAMVTQRMGTQPPDVRTTPATLIREDGEWKDCTPPDEH